jgi:hypothetical protein
MAMISDRFPVLDPFALNRAFHAWHANNAQRGLRRSASWLLDCPWHGVPNVRTVAVMNEKGGSGKTTTTISLAAVLAERGFRILVVDLDPQASASLWLGRGREPGLYRAIAEKSDLEPFVRATRGPRVSRNKQEDSYGSTAWNMTGPGGKGPKAEVGSRYPRGSGESRTAGMRS